MKNKMNRLLSLVGVIACVGMLCPQVSGASEKRTAEQDVILELSHLKRFIPSFNTVLDSNEKIHFEKVDLSNQEAVDLHQQEVGTVRKTTEGYKILCRSTLAEVRKALNKIPDSNPKKAEYTKQLEVYQAQYDRSNLRLQNMVKGIYTKAPEKSKAVSEQPAHAAVKSKAPPSCRLESIKLTKGPWNPCRGGKCYPEFPTSASRNYFEATDAAGVRVYVKCESTKWKSSSQAGKGCTVVGMPSNPASHSYGSCTFKENDSKYLNTLREIDNKRYWKPYFKKIMLAKKAAVKRPEGDPDGTPLVGGLAGLIEDCVSNSVLDSVTTRKEPENWTIPDDGKSHTSEAGYYESSAHLVYGLSLGTISGQCEKSEGLDSSQKLCVIPATCTRPSLKDKYTTVVVCGSHADGSCPAFEECKNDTGKFDYLPTSVVAAAPQAVAPEAAPDAAQPVDAGSTEEIPQRLRDIPPAL